MFIIDGFISDEKCDEIIATMESYSENHSFGRSGASAKEKKSNSSPWKISTDWHLTRHANESQIDNLLNLDKYLFNAYRKFFVELDQYYCQWPFPHSPQSLKDLQSGNMPWLGNTFQIARDDGFQVQKTLPGEYYKWHVDRANGVVSGHRRVFSTILYLNDGFQGGETGFPRQALKIRPRKGRLVCTYSDFTHLHGGLPVTKGEKYLMFIAYEHAGETSFDDNGSLRN